MGGHRDLSWGEVGNLVGEVDRRGHLEAACSKGRDKDRGKGHANEVGEEGGNIETYAPMEVSYRSPCGVLTMGKGYENRLVLGISLGCGPSRGPLDHDDDSFHAPSLAPCRI